MDRRELLKMIAVLTGGAVIGGEVFLSGCKTGAKADVGFTATNIALLDEIGETIIPATATPGAKAAKVGEFMKVMVTDCYTQEQQDAFMKGISTIDEVCKKTNNKSFMDCTPEQRHELLVSLEKEAKEFNAKQEEADKPRKEELNAKDKGYDFVASPRHYYTMMKQLTLLGFFSSKTGMTETLRHVPVPGKYDGAFPYAKGDKAWAE
ncbi:MAG: gluconate 2-dehydrogenase subunit 3 family protein [Chitinophagaceae bacterium]|nr:gluconate 2-dehydrogenase subunit 3 family protein [Chitinophagaceae bacterium]MBP9104148.1 gluconate 2-dehydrogenase subunit 3 family protein [Chitinophagaceae bacterium]